MEWPDYPPKQTVQPARRTAILVDKEARFGRGHRRRVTVAAWPESLRGEEKLQTLVAGDVGEDGGGAEEGGGGGGRGGGATAGRQDREDAAQVDGGDGVRAPRDPPVHGGLVPLHRRRAVGRAGLLRARWKTRH